MNLEQINELIINYNKLIDLAKSKIKVIEGIDSQYNTARGIEEISFDIDTKTVYVKCDDSCRGCYDSLSFEFPIEWLSKTDLELWEIVKSAMESRKAKARLDAEEKKNKEKIEAEQRELEQYKRLREKFENKSNEEQKN